MAVFRVPDLPEDSLAAAAAFHGDVLARLSKSLDAQPPCLTIVFPKADHAHRAWRLAAVQGLARRYAPLRVNAVASDDEIAVEAGVRYLEAAEGVTGQYLPLDGKGAGQVLHRQ